MGYDPDHKVSCCYEGCYATINLAPKDYKRLKRTGEWFYCPAGHQQHFTGKTDEQKEIDRLGRKLQKLQREFGRVHDQRELAIDVIRHCPICGVTPGRHIRIYRNWWRYEDDVANVRDWMREHIETAHGAVLEPAEAS